MFKVLLIVVLCSCAVMEKIEIKKEEVVPFKEYSTVTYAKKSVDQFEITEVIDARPTKEVIGEGLLGVYFTKTPVYFYKEMTSFLKDYFYSSFEARNFKVVDSSNNRLRIIVEELEVKELIEKFKPERALCHVRVNFEFTKKTKQTNISTYVKIISKGDMGDGTQKLAPTLASCLNEIVEKLVGSKEIYEFL